MYRIIDTIHDRAAWTHRYPHLAERTPGGLVILDLITATPPVLQGRPVVLHRPDGTTQTCIVDAVESNSDHSVALFFRDQPLTSCARCRLAMWWSSKMCAGALPRRARSTPMSKKGRMAPIPSPGSARSRGPQDPSAPSAAPTSPVPNGARRASSPPLPYRHAGSGLLGLWQAVIGAVQQLPAVSQLSCWRAVYALPGDPPLQGKEHARRLLTIWADWIHHVRHASLTEEQLAAAARTVGPPLPAGHEVLAVAWAMDAWCQAQRAEPRWMALLLGPRS